MQYCDMHLSDISLIVITPLNKKESEKKNSQILKLGFDFKGVRVQRIFVSLARLGAGVRL